MDYLKANRKASRQEEIESHGHPIQGRAMIHKSKKVYDRNRMKRAAIKSDDSSHFLSYVISNPSPKLRCLVRTLQKLKEQQRKELLERKEHTFTINL